MTKDATEDYIGALREKARRKAQKNMLAFTKYTFGPDYEVNWHHRRICHLLDQWIAGKIERLIISCPPRHGKALHVDTPILTPQGFTRIADLTPGDTVFDNHGRPTNVLAKSKIFEDRLTYRVKTQDGAEVVADSNHRWRYCRSKPDQEWGLANTQDLYTRDHIHLPKQSPVKTPPSDDLPVHPWVLGYWLGDGNSRDPTSIACKADRQDEVREIFEKFGYKTTTRSDPSRFGVLGISSKIKSLGLCPEKFVPREYLYASANQRLELLRGLVDSDGTTRKDRGETVFWTTNQNLAESVQFLARSLGRRAYLNEVKSRSAYQVHFYHESPARLSKKSEPARDQKRFPSRKAKIEPNGRADTVCIQVSAPNGMFLAGRGLVPTHNSELCSRRLPAYILGKQPNSSIIACSYGQDLAEEMSVDVKKIIESDAYREVFPETRLPQHSSANSTKPGSGKRHLRNKKDLWEVVNGSGRYLARGVGSGITGMGGQYLLVDDPIKDAEQANNQSERDKVWEWWNKVLKTRASRNASFLIIQTRWHQDDLVGRIKRHANEIDNAPTWHIYNYPALNRSGVDDLDPQDPRSPGDALWPWFKDRQEWLVKEKSDPSGFASLDQGMPSPPGGDILKKKWIEEAQWTELPEPPHKWLWSIDPKGGSKDSHSAECVVQLWVFSKSSPANAYLFDQRKGIWSQSETEDVLRELAQTNPWKKADKILIEGKGDGPGIKDHLHAELPGIILIDPWADKEQRLRDVQTFWRAGNVHIPDHRELNDRRFSWVKEFVAQHTAFPGSQRDDQVDASTYAIDHILGSRADTSPGTQEHYISKYYG